MEVSGICYTLKTAQTVRDTLLARSEKVDGHKPFLQCQACTLEEGPCGERALVMAFVALIQPAAFQLIVARVAAFGANKSVQPAQAKQGVTSRLLGALLIHFEAKPLSSVHRRI
jgi:hypothetical protein